MSHVIVERRTLYWPRTLGGSGISTVAMPGLPHHGTFTNAPADDAASFTGDTYASLKKDLEACAIRLDIPEDTIAIGIAPDSIIQCCDIAIGGRGDERSRSGISPGSPLIGCHGNAYALVSLRSPIPQIAFTSSCAVDSNGLLTVPQGGGACPAWPLRLELFRACAVPPQRSDKRAPMSSLSLFSVPDAGAGRQLYTCVDGRRRVDIEIVAPDGGAGITVEVFNVVALRDEPNQDTEYQIPVELDAAGSLSEVVGAGASEGRTFSFYGNPFGILCINLSTAGAALPCQVRVRAWD